MGIDVRFSAADWERIERDYAAWWAHELDRPLVQITGWQPEPGLDYAEVPGYYSNYGFDVSVEEALHELTPHLEAQRYYGDAFPNHFVNFGPGIMAGFLGCRVHSVPDTVWFEPAEERAAQELQFSYDADNPWWRRVRDWTRAAVEMWQGRVQVSHTDLGGNLDVLASFRTTEGLLLDLYDAPEEVDRLVGEVTALWLRYYDELDAIIRASCPGRVPWAPIWSTGTSYMLQCDFSYMISPQMFDRFVMPDLTACCEHLDAGFYHLDGPGEIPHLQQLLSMPRLRGVQWVPGAGAPPPDEWPHLLQRIIEADKVCQIFVSPEGALSVARTLGGRGFMFTISERMDADEADAFLKELADADVSHRHPY